MTTGDALLSDLALLAEQMGQATTRGEVLSALVANARGLLSYTACALALTGSEGWEVWRVAAVRPTEVAHRQGVPEEAVETLDRFVSHGQPLQIDDLLAPPWSESSHREVLWKDGTRSALLVPLVAGGQRVGALSFTSTRPDQYPESKRAIATFLAWMVATSLQSLPDRAEVK